MVMILDLLLLVGVIWVLVHLVVEVVLVVVDMVLLMPSTHILSLLGLGIQVQIRTILGIVEVVVRNNCLGVYQHMELRGHGRE